MITKVRVKRLTHLLSITFSLLLAGLIGCGGGVSNESDFEAVNTSAPVNDWVMVWNDEFDGAQIDTSKWTHEVNCNGGGNQEQQCYTDSPDNSFVSNGVLNIVALPAEEGAALPYTSARLNTRYKGDFKYGRFEMRAKLPQGQGTWPAFWMLPTDYVYGGWPKSGEVDILEAVNLKTVDENGVEEASIVGQLYYGKSSPNQSSSGREFDLPDNINPADDFHTYALEWQEGEIRWYVDGYLFQTQRASEVRYNSKGEAVGLIHRGWFAEYFDIVTGELEDHWDAAPFDQDFHLLLNLAVGGNWAANVNNLGIDATAFENGQTYEIDYVRVYECSINPEDGKGCETVRQGYDDEEDALVLGVAPIPSPPSTGIAQDLTIFADEENPGWPLWDCCGGTTPTIETDDEEHGAVAQFVIGEAPTVMGFNTFEAEVQQAFDASPMLTTGAVSFEMKVVTPPVNTASVWKFKIESGGASQAVELDLAASNEGQAPVTGEWQTYTYDLQTLADAGLDLSNIDVLMIFPAWDTGNGAVYRVDNVQIAQEGGGASFPELVMFEDEVNPLWQPWDCCGGSTPTVETDDAEHGASVEFQIGAAPTVMGFSSRPGHGVDNGVPFDATALLQEGVVQFDMKVVTAPSNTASVWKFKIESDDGSTAVEVDLSTSTEGVDPVTGEWQTYTFPMQTLSDAGLDISAIDVVMIFPAWDTGEGAVYRVDNAKIYNPNASSGGGSAAQGLSVYADGAADLWAIWDCCGGSTPTDETDDAEHGTVAEFIIGATPTVMGFTSRPGHGVDGGVPYDATAFLQTGVVQFEMKVVNAPSNTDSVWKFKIESSDGATAVELDLTASNEAAAPVTGEWQTYTYQLSDLFDAGLDISSIDVIMVFPAWDTGNGAVYRVDNVFIGQLATEVPSGPSVVLFEDAENPLWIMWDCCAGSTPTVETDDATHGATAQFTIGATPTVMGFTSREGHGTVGGSPFDATDLLANGEVRFEMKVMTAPSNTASVWKFKIESGDGATAVELDLAASNEGAAPVTGEWQTYTYSLQDLFDAGLDISAIDVVMVFPAWDTGNGAVYRIDNAVIANP